MNKIFLIGGLKVMRDKVLAELYQAKTSVLKQALKEILIGFPMILYLN
jgi:hypothetical protein